MFGLWDNVYHQNAIKSLDGVGRWDPTQASKTLAKKKQVVESSSDESEDSDEDGEDKEDGEDDKDDKSEEEEEVLF